jgi:hypothetical protein
MVDSLFLSGRVQAAWVEWKPGTFGFEVMDLIYENQKERLPRKYRRDELEFTPADSTS